MFDVWTILIQNILRFDFLIDPHLKTKKIHRNIAKLFYYNLF